MGFAEIILGLTKKLSFYKKCRIVTCLESHSLDHRTMAWTPYLFVYKNISQQFTSIQIQIKWLLKDQSLPLDISYIENQIYLILYIQIIKHKI